MKVITDYIEISTKGHTDILDVTDQVRALLKKSGMSEGQLTVFVSGATAGVTTTITIPISTSMTETALGIGSMIRRLIISVT